MTKLSDFLTKACICFVSAVVIDAATAVKVDVAFSIVAAVGCHCCIVKNDVGAAAAAVLPMLLLALLCRLMLMVSLLLLLISVPASTATATNTNNRNIND